MSLALVLCTFPSYAQSGYPGGSGGSGYPGGSGGGTAPDPGHRWNITYSGSGTTSYAIPSGYGGTSIPHSDPWGHWNYGAFWGVTSETDINGSCTGTVTATLTWIPTAGQTSQSDPPAKMVSIIETGSACESPGTWGALYGVAPVGVGSVADGLGDTKVPSGSGYTCSGSHRVKQDGSSGTITLGPFTLTATCPVSNWETEYEIIGESPLFSYEYHYWDWFGGSSDVSFGVQVVPPAYPVNFHCTKAEPDNQGALHYEYAWESSTGKLADLSGCTIKERLSYANNVGGVHGVYESTGQTLYIPPFPFEGTFADPEIYGGTSGTQGSEGDDHWMPSIPGSPMIPGLYKYGAYTAEQEYIYTDENSDPNNPNDYTVLRGPIDIYREVYAPGMNWIYQITKYDAPEGSSQPYAEATVVLGPVYTEFGP